MKIHPSLYAALLIVIAAIAFQLLLPSVFDFALNNGEDILVDGWLKISSLTVYVSPTAGFRAVGW